MFEIGQRVIITRGNLRGQVGTITVHNDGSAWYGVDFEGFSASYKTTSFKAA